MAFQLLGSKEERYQGLASLNWPYPENYEPKVIPKGSRVNILQRGCFTTDDKGMTLTVNGISQSEIMSGILNHAWDIWVRPELDRYQKEGIVLPERVSTVLIKLENEQMRLHVNTSLGRGYMVKRPGIAIPKGGGITSDMILDVVDVIPPMYADKATSYFFVRFNGEQISIVFDMRPGNNDFQDEWTYEDQQWYGNALAEQMLSSIYGHLILRQQRLVECNLPFCLGLQSNKMYSIAEAAEKSIAAAEQYLVKNVSTDDWRPIIANWASSEFWRHRESLFVEALASYESGNYAATVLLLLPQIEGTIMEYLVSKNKGLRPDGHTKKWSANSNNTSVMKDLKDDFEKRDFGYVRQAVAFTLLDFFRGSSLYSNFSWKDGGEPVGRHPILHGYDVNFGKKVNADRLLMVLDSLFWLIGIKVSGIGKLNRNYGEEE